MNFPTYRQIWKFAVIAYGVLATAVLVICGFVVILWFVDRFGF